MSLETGEPHALTQQRRRRPRQGEGKCVQSVNASQKQCESSAGGIDLRLCERFAHKIGEKTLSLMSQRPREAFAFAREPRLAKLKQRDAKDVKNERQGLAHIVACKLQRS